MEYYTYPTHDDYLAHYGVLGMKWGVRRYQNKDGSLTPAGEKHRDKREARQAAKHDKAVAKQRQKALEKARATKAANKVAAEKAAAEAAKRQKMIDKGLISPKKMTTEELNEALKRKEAIKKYNDKVLETSTMKRFMSKAWNDAVVPGLTEGGKRFISDFTTKKLKELTGLDAPSEYEKLKKANEMSKWKKEIAENKDWFDNRKAEAALAKSKREKEIAENNLTKFNKERDLAESQKNYQDYLDGKRDSYNGGNNSKKKDKNNQNQNQNKDKDKDKNKNK